MRHLASLARHSRQSLLMQPVLRGSVYAPLHPLPLRCYLLPPALRLTLSNYALVIPTLKLSVRCHFQILQAELPLLSMLLLLQYGPLLFCLLHLHAMP